MRKLVFLVLAAALYLVPEAAMAQPARPPAPLMPQAQAQKVGDVFGLTANQVVAIGIGMLGGVVIAEAVDIAIILGAVAGGLIGNWWYAENAGEGSAGTVKK